MLMVVFNGSVHNIYNNLNSCIFVCVLLYHCASAFVTLLQAFVHTCILCLNLHEALMYGFK